MAETEPTPKFLESPLLNDAEPSAAWSIDELGAAAAAEMAVLVNGEQSVTARYWRLGRLLSLARKPLTHGQWGRFLKQWKIDMAAVQTQWEYFMNLLKILKQN